MVKDINSLIEHTKFGFERLDYLQDTFLGLVNIEQNKIIKNIYGGQSVIFYAPDTDSQYLWYELPIYARIGLVGRLPFAILLMILASGVTLLYFKKRIGCKPLITCQMYIDIIIDITNNGKIHQNHIKA